MHFVRRRRLTRKQFFNGKSGSILIHTNNYQFQFNLLTHVPLCLCMCVCSVAYNLIRTMEPLTCDYCDLDEVERLASLLLDKFVRASLVRHPHSFAGAKVNKLKNEFVEALGLTNGDLVMQYSYENTEQILNKFVEMGKSSLSMASLALGSSSLDDLYDRRLVEVVRGGALDKGECIDLAKLFLQRFDPEYSFHCDTANCSRCEQRQPQEMTTQNGESECENVSAARCPFRYEVCPHQDCGTEYSAKWAQRHDSGCPLKPVDCERACGRSVLRKLMGHHIQDECILRPVRCQYVALGCEASK